MFFAFDLAHRNQRHRLPDSDVIALAFRLDLRRSLDERGKDHLYATIIALWGNSQYCRNRDATNDDESLGGVAVPGPNGQSGLGPCTLRVLVRSAVCTVAAERFLPRFVGKHPRDCP